MSESAIIKIGDIVEIVRSWGTVNNIGDERFVFGVNREAGLIFIDCGAQLGWMPNEFFQVKIKRSES